MTRETKIGLLVGLAFIIVIGILLSDHLTSATEPQQAQLAQVAGNVRNGVAVPGANDAPAATNVVTPNNIAPQQTVPTKEEITPKQPPVEIVQIRGSSPPQQQPEQITVTTAAPPAEGTSAAKPPEPPISVADASASAPAPANPVKSSLEQVAKTFNEELVPVGAPSNQPTHPTLAAAALPPGARQYKAEVGDSVSRLAARFLGGNTTANRNAIIAANPTLQKNPNILVIGRTYVIPAAGAAPVAPAPTAEAAPAPAAPTDVVQAPAATSEFFYTVKPGDSLTKIAVEQLGSAAGVPAIMDLNKETLKGRDVIRPNMKLRLPAKPTAG